MWQRSELVPRMRRALLYVERWRRATGGRGVRAKNHGILNIRKIIISREPTLSSDGAWLTSLQAIRLAHGYTCGLSAGRQFKQNQWMP